MSGNVYHEFDCERLYEELNNFKLYLEDCKKDAEDPKQFDFDAHLASVGHLMNTLEEVYDCGQ